MKTIIILMAVMFCSFSAYSHLNWLDVDDVIHYREIDKTRFDKSIYSSVIAYCEEGFFTDSYYIHYHVYKFDQITNQLITRYDLPHYNREFTYEISRDAYERIINTSDYMYLRPLSILFDDRLIFH